MQLLILMNSAVIDLQASPPHENQPSIKVEKEGSAKEGILVSIHPFYSFARGAEFTH